MEELTSAQIDHFINNGFVKIENAFSTETADECRALLWQATQCSPHKPETWIQPVIRIGEMGQEPFKRAANTAILYRAFDQLVGKDNWLPRTTLGSFPIRFPSTTPATDTGWHVDASFPGENVSNFLEWRINVASKGRALLMLFLFSDVNSRDAPTIIKAGSHIDVVKLLEPAAGRGLSFLELAQQLDSLPPRTEILATGKAGTVYLCHPFLVHAAQDHHGTMPRFMAQPPLLPRNDFDIQQSTKVHCAVEIAIMKGLSHSI